MDDNLSTDPHTARVTHILSSGDFSVRTSDITNYHAHKLLIRKTCPCDLYPLHSKIGVYRGIHNFLIFALKHKL